ncbi:SPFH domain-containing protein [Patescibacteria group bacterium]|nr:SPFH domain-containing protein [Patescibacteria group bacterium]
MPGIIFLVILLVAIIKQVQEYERGVTFTMGKYTGTKKPGWRIVIPVFQAMQKVDLRLKAVDVPNQEAITKDNISVQINAVIYYEVKEAEKAIIQVENFKYATSQLAQTTMRNIVGEITLDHLLQNRDEVSRKIQGIVEEATNPWGISVQNVELKDIVLPENMKRTIAKEAEAERERRAVIIKAEGEVQAADNMAKAAKTLATAPGALHLRTLQSINDLSSDQSNTTIWMIPVEGLEALKSIAMQKQ